MVAFFIFILEYNSHFYSSDDIIFITLFSFILIIATIILFLVYLMKMRTVKGMIGRTYYNNEEAINNKIINILIQNNIEYKNISNKKNLLDKKLPKRLQFIKYYYQSDIFSIIIFKEEQLPKNKKIVSIYLGPLEERNEKIIKKLMKMCDMEDFP